MNLRGVMVQVVCGVIGVHRPRRHGAAMPDEDSSWALEIALSPDMAGTGRRVVEAADKLSCQAAIIDGEIIVQDENGISDFDALRSAIQRTAWRGTSRC
jgi:hypothetical protein